MLRHLVKEEVYNCPPSLSGFICTVNLDCRAALLLCVILQVYMLRDFFKEVVYYFD